MEWKCGDVLCVAIGFVGLAGIAGCSGGSGEPSATATQALVPAGAFLTLAGSTNSLGFAHQTIGTVSIGQQLTLLNAGTGDLTLTTVEFTGDNPADFSLGAASTCIAKATLGAGQTCLLDVAFAPTDSGTRTARITLTDSAEGSPHSIPVSGLGAAPGAVFADSGPIDLRIGFPAYYEDNAGLKLQLCYDSPTLCLTTSADPTQEPLVADTGGNFIDESFYWVAEIQNQRVGPGLGGRAILIMAVEAAFANDGIVPGEQIVFGRVRIRLQKMTANATYTVTYPYGTRAFLADSSGTVNDTVDIGCAAAPCDFHAALTSPLLGAPFPRWDPAVAPAAPPGFLGDPNVPHRIVGAPTGNNFFRIAGPNAGGTGVNTITFTNFTVAGEILQ